MATLGEIQHRLTKLPHGAGVDTTVLKGIINDRLQNLLSSYPWSHLHKTSIIETVAKYDTGTIAVAAGGTALTLTGGTWTTAMSGREIRLSGRSEFYTFTRTSDTTGTIDRGYEGLTETIATYRIFQRLYSLPSDIDFIESLTVLGINLDLDEVTAEDLDKAAPSRLIYGRPNVYADATDSITAGIVTSRVELYPIPEIAEGLRLRYTQTVANLVSTSDILLSWIPVDVLIAGCESDLFSIKESWTGAAFKLEQFEAGVRDMKRYDGNRENAAELIMDDRYTWHRTERAAGWYYVDRHFWQLRNSN